MQETTNKKEITNKVVGFAAILLAIVAFIYFCYTYNNTMKELPYLTWINQMRNVGIPYLDGNLKLSNLLSRYDEHGLLRYNLLYIINIQFFNLTTKFHVVLNDIFALFSFVCIVVAMITSMKKSAVRFFAPICTIALFVFSILQGSSGAMELCM